MTATVSTRFTQETASQLWSEHSGKAVLSLDDPRFLQLAQHFLTGAELAEKPVSLLGPGWTEVRTSGPSSRFVLKGRLTQELRFVFSFDEQSATLSASGEELRVDPDQLASLV